MATKGISCDFMDLLVRYSWPGNVRELINTLETAISTAANEDMLFSRHLPEYIRIQVARASLNDKLLRDDTNKINIGLNTLLPTFKKYRKVATERAEKEYLEKLTSVTNGDVHAACRISQLSRSRYYELIKMHEIPVGQQTVA